MFEIIEDHDEASLIKAAGECTCGLQEEDTSPIDPFLGLLACVVFGIAALAIWYFMGVLL